VGATPAPPGFEGSRPAAPEELRTLPNRAAIHTLEKCITIHHIAEVDYTDAEGHESTITIRPAFIRYNNAHHVVLWGIATDQENWEELRLDRIRSARDTGEEFTPTW
jgi:predicted DNA-binding transcriptional regulator YafY